MILKQCIPFILGVSLITACSNNDANQEPQINSSTKSTSRVEKTFAAGDSAVQAYLAVQKALVSSEADSVSRAALKGFEVFEEGDTLGALMYAIAMMDEISLQRTAFEELTMEFIPRIDTQRAGGLYVQHCPMAFDNKGASWVSNQERIANPYFGDEMLRCGFTKKAWSSQGDSLND